MQKQFRQLKAQINSGMSMFRTSFNQQKGQVSDGEFWTGFFMGQRAAGRNRQRQRAAIDDQKKAILSPFEILKSNIRNIILEVDRIKLELEQIVLANKLGN